MKSLPAWIFFTLIGAAALLGAEPETANAEARLVSVGWVSPSILEVTMDAGAVVHQPLRGFRPDPNDDFILSGPEVSPRLRPAAHLSTWPDGSEIPGGARQTFWFVRRGKENLGWVVGPHREHLWPVQPWRGTEVVLAGMTAEQFRLRRAGTDGEGVRPARVTHKTKPHWKGATGPGYEGPLGRRHTVLLDWGDAGLAPGDYELAVLVPGMPSTLDVRIDDLRRRSEAVQVNLAGYEQGAGSKKGFYSYWLGEWGGVAFGPSVFEVRDAESGVLMYQGRPRLRTDPDGTEWRDETGREFRHAGGPVWELDFSEWDQPGHYVLRVPGVGLSAEFTIRQGVWRDAFSLQMRGVLHQRSGMALGAPFTDYERPRNLHPADGQLVLSCDEELFWEHQLKPGESESNPFARIGASAVPSSENTEAWGSWADAADHDRRYLHLELVHVLLSLWDVNPRFFRAQRLGLPTNEASNTLPDILDEAIWGLDLYRRMQREDGAIIYGIESLYHPNRGEPSWLETLPVAVVPPTPDAAFTYAGAAARLARALRAFDPDGSEVWLGSARRAFDWAVGADGDAKYPPRYRTKRENRLMAAWQLLQGGPDANCQRFWQREMEAAMAEWRALPAASRPLFQNLFPMVELALAEDGPEFARDAQEFWRHALIETADDLIAGAAESAYGLLRKPGSDYFYWIVEAEGAPAIMAAHRLTGDRRYLDALEGAAHYAMGANPLNLAFTSGLGSRSITPMIGDAEFAQTGYPKGIPAYGPAVISADGLPRRAWGWDERRAKALAGSLWPNDLTAWPLYETYFESIALPVINEFTLHQGICDQLLRWGYLAQYYALPADVESSGSEVTADGYE